RVGFGTRGDGVFHAEGPDAQPADAVRRRAAAEQTTEVVREAAHVGALGAVHFQDDAVRFKGEDFQAVDAYGPRGQRDGFPVPYAVASPFAVDLDRRIRRRHLRDFTA